MESVQRDIIDITEIYRELKAHRRRLIIAPIVAFILAVAWILPVPRTYTSTVSLAPEISTGSSGTLGEIASNFGIDLSAGQNVDAFYPALYPSLLESTDFIVQLFDVQVKTLKGDVCTDYYTYLAKHQKSSFWTKPFNAAKRKLNELLEEPVQIPQNKKSGKRVTDPTFLTKQENDVIKAITSNVKCMVDKKTEVITITVTDQDPLICAMIADSVQNRLQAFIIDYRTRKARIDVNYYKELQHEAKSKYEASIQAYSAFSDSHVNSVMETTAARKSALNSEVQSKLAVYNSVTAQLQAAEAKLQERTPSFTMIQRPIVPIRPSGPKRMLFVAGMFIITFFLTAIWTIRRQLFKVKES